MSKLLIEQKSKLFKPHQCGIERNPSLCLSLCSFLPMNVVLPCSLMLTLQMSSKFSRAQKHYARRPGQFLTCVPLQLHAGAFCAGLQCDADVAEEQQTGQTSEALSMEDSILLPTCMAFLLILFVIACSLMPT